MGTLKIDMSDDSNKKPVSLSTPQATANLDDVLSSLEKQVSTGAPIESAVTPAVSEPIVTEVPKAVDPVVAEPVLETTPVVTPISNPFSVEETPIAQVTEVKAPVAESLPSFDSMKDHPQVDTASMPSFSPTPAPIAEPVVTAPPKEKKSFFGGLSLTPKFIGAALVVALVAIGSVGAYVAFQTPKGTVNTPSQATDCKINYNGTSSFTISGGCSGTITRFNGPSCPTTQTKVAEFAVSNETYSPQPPSGQCQQVDHNFSGTDNAGKPIGAGGVCACNNPAPAKKSCGETCTSNDQCRNPSANGAGVACISGTCQNTACPGHTNPGVNCDCNVALRQCGQTCSGALGLCAAGQGTCTYVNTNAAMCPWSGAQTYCAGNLNGYTRVSCSAGDTGGQYLKGPTGKTTGFTLAEIAASCKTVATPTPTPSPTPSPTPVTNVCVISNITVVPAPNTSDWNHTGAFTVKNTGTTTTTFNYFLDAWTDNGLDKKGTLTLKPGETAELGLGKICSKWQLDIGCPPKYDDKGYVVEANPSACVTPTPTAAPLVCAGITSSDASPELGSSVRFTCGTITGATSYEFRYKYSINGNPSANASLPANGNVSTPLVISQAAKYNVQCRPCIGDSCTPWEAW